MYPEFFLSHYGRYNKDTHTAANSARTAAREAKTEVAHLEAEIDRLLMITEALWSFLKEEHHYDDTKLINRIKEIDLKDGHMDGRSKPTDGPALCSNCQRALSPRHYKCIYCGTEISQQPFKK